MLDKSLLYAKNTVGLQLGTKIHSTDGRYIFHISIIDYLQKYTIFKKLERYYKISFLGAQG